MLDEVPRQVSGTAASSLPASDSTTVCEPVRRTASAAAARADAAWLELPGADRFALTAGTVRLGRAPDNDVVLDDSRVSRYHAQIRRRGDRFTLVDLGSTNGTRIGSQPVTEQALRTGDTIYLGGVPLRFHGGR